MRNQGASSHMTNSIKRHLRLALHKDLLLDLEDRARAEAVKAFEMIRDRSGLDRKRSCELEGQARFRMMEQGFEEVCTLHGAHRLEGAVIPRTELKVFQPFMRFEVEWKGVILGLATMPEPKAVPLKNKSRLAGVSLNYDLSPRLDFDGKGPESRRRFRSAAHIPTSREGRANRGNRSRHRRIRNMRAICFTNFSKGS